MIENETRTKSTSQWLNVLEESGMPYAAVNDIQGTLTHPHGMIPKCWPEVYNHTNDKYMSSTRTRHGQRNRAPDLWSDETRQHTRQILVFRTEYSNAAAVAGAAHG